MVERRNTQIPIIPNKLFVLAVWWLSTGWAYAAQSKPPDRPAPLWAAPVLQEDQNTANPRGNDLSGVTFLDNDRLIVHEVDRTGELSSRTALDASSAFRLHVSILEASSGRAVSNKDWDTRAHNTSIRVTKDGVLVRTGQLVRFYSKDFVDLQQVALPQPDPHDTWIVSVSATGKTVMLNHYDLKESHFEVRDGSTFKQLKAWSEAPLRHPYSISDVGIATADSHQKHIVLSEFGSGRWVPLGKGFACVSSPTLVTERVLANAACKELSIVTTEGDVLMTDHSEEHESFSGEKIAVAQSGAVLASSLIQGKGGGFFDRDVHRTKTHVAVYDLTLKKRVLTVDVSPLPGGNYDFALSPDGSKLAILNDREVSVYTVPVKPSDHSDDKCGDRRN